MEKDIKVKRGEIYYADFSIGNNIGSEQNGIRPVAIIQNNIGNNFSPTIIVIPITSKLTSKAKLPTHINLKNLKYRNIKNSMLLAEQIRVIDKTRLTEFIGKLDEDELKLAERAVLIALGINVKNYMNKNDLSNV